MEDKRTVEDLYITTQTIMLTLEVDDFSIEDFQETAGRSKKLLIRDKDMQKFRNKISFYIDIGEKELYGDISKNTLCFRGCKSKTQAIKAGRMIINYINDCKVDFPNICKGYITIIKCDEIMTNAMIVLDKDIGLKRIYNHFKDVETCEAEYLPTHQSNLRVRYNLGKFKGVDKYLTITVTRRGKITFSGRTYASIIKYFDDFCEKLYEILPYATV